MIRTLTVVTASLFAVGSIAQTVPIDLLNDIGPIANLSAVGILGYLVKLLLAEIRDQRKDAKEVATTHTAAMAGVAETMRQITSTCARTQAKLIQESEQLRENH